MNYWPILRLPIKSNTLITTFSQSLNFRTEKGYPLLIEPTKIEVEESPCDVEFVDKILSKIDYQALVLARKQISDRCTHDLGSDFILPEIPESFEKLNENNMDGTEGKSDGVEEEEKSTNLNEELMRQFHLILLDIHVVEGHLICPDTGRRFKITNGIPNMILHEDEI